MSAATAARAFRISIPRKTMKREIRTPSLRMSLSNRQCPRLREDIVMVTKNDGRFG